jgi:hypothetical protein
VHVDGVGVEILVVSAAKVAHVFILVEFFTVFVAVTIHKVILLLAFV